MATTEKYTTVIELNSEQAKRNLDELRKHDVTDCPHIGNGGE